MGSPVQVNRLIQKEEEEEARRRAELQRVKIIEAERLKETQMKEERRKKKEIKRQREEEERKRKEEEEEKNGLAALLGGGRAMSPAKGGRAVPKNIEKLLRQSLNSQATDYDQRDRGMLNCMRKLFEEARANDIDELNGEPLFKDEAKNFDGTVQKEDVIYALLNHESLSLTRTEVGAILQLVSDINRSDQGRVDIDELHFSYCSYLKYYEIIE